jgi:hypothetical protein
LRGPGFQGSRVPAKPSKVKISAHRAGFKTRF